MARQRKVIKMTPAKVRAAMAAGKGTTLWDSVVRGFGLRVTENGHGSYFVDYYTAKGQRRRHTFAKVKGRPSESDVRSARQEAARLHGEVKDGEDPRSKRKALREAPTIADLWKRFKADHVAKKAPSTQRSYTDHFERHLLPRLGEDTLVCNVHWEDFAAVHSSLSDTPTHADRVMATASIAWRFATRLGWWPRSQPNPAQDHQLNRPKPKKRALTRPELATLGKALKGEKSMAARLLELALLTGARLKEIRMMEWDRVDLERRLMVLEETDPDRRGKSGGRFIYLGEAAAAVLADLKRTGPYVFPSPKDRKGYSGTYGSAPYGAGGYNACWARLTDGTTMTDVTAYQGTRHTFLTFGEALGIADRRLRLLTGHAGATGDAHEGYKDASHPDLIASVMADADRLSGYLRQALDGTAVAPQKEGRLLEFAT